MLLNVPPTNFFLSLLPSPLFCVVFFVYALGLLVTPRGSHRHCAPQNTAREASVCWHLLWILSISRFWNLYAFHTSVFKGSRDLGKSRHYRSSSPSKNGIVKIVCVCFHWIKMLSLSLIGYIMLSKLTYHLGNQFPHL
jgi:hypothetical protein